MALNSTLVLDLGKEIGIIYLGILIGYFLGKSRYYSVNLSRNLSRFAIYVVFPIVIITNTVNIGTGLVSELLIVLIISVGLHLFLLGISVLFLKANTPLEKGSSVLTASIPNAIGFSFPIIAALQGLTGWVPATIFALGTRLTISTAGGAVALNYSKTTGHKLSLTNHIMRLLKFPLFIAMFIGLFIRGTVGYIETTQSLLVIFWSYVGISIGLLLIGLDCRTLTKSIILKSGLNRSILVRFVASPVITISLCIVFQLPRLIAVPMIVQSWAPPAIMTILYSEFFGLDTKITSRNVTLLTFVALLLLPFEIFVILWLYPM